MNIACYNLRLGGKAGNQVHWRQILEHAQPDIFLAQETKSPEHYLTADRLRSFNSRVHWMSARNVSWGSAILTTKGVLQPIVMQSHPGYVVAAEVRGWGPPVERGRRLRIFSLHVPPPYIRSMNQILDEILSLPDAKKCDHVIGGDFNLTTGVRHPSEKRQQHNLFLLDRLRRELNLMNAWQIANPNRNLPQTLRWGKDKSEPYHCDAIFLPARWYKHLESCHVLSSPEWDKLSDHNPVLARLHIPASET